jgi:hypothetical protein
MKTIVVSGAHSNVGKTKLARELCRLLPGARHVKIGHGARKTDAGNVFYHTGTPFSRIARENKDAAFLVVESNSILDEMDPECVIYLPGGEPKPSATRAAGRADIVRGERIEPGTIERLSRSIGVDEETVLGIAERAGALTTGR